MLWDYSFLGFPLPIVFLIMLIIWLFAGIIWCAIYRVDVREYILYKEYSIETIIIGGPIWWAIAIWDFLKEHKYEIKYALRPRKKE